jgi:hypothetical protein
MVALGGCGISSSENALRRPCTEKTLRAVSRALAVSPKLVKARAGVGGNGSPQCRYAAGRDAVVVNLDAGAQPYFRLERTAVEASQQFGLVRAVAAPLNVTGVGLDAWWYPDEDQFETTDGVRLIMVRVTAPGVSKARREAIGKAAGRSALGRIVQPPGFHG